MKQATKPEEAMTEHEELEALREKKWDIMDELAAVELAITALLNRIRGVEHDS